MTLLLQDGSKGGHTTWVAEAVQNGVADGTIISPFNTPRVSVPRHPSAGNLVQAVREANSQAEILFDASTHGAMLPGTDKWEHYRSWGNDLWLGGAPSLGTPVEVTAHVRGTFGVQQRLSVPLLAPTIAVDSPHGAEARLALVLAAEARQQDPSCYQSLVGRRGLWAAGADLDAYVGRLAQLRAPVWVMTAMYDVRDYPPNLSNTAVTEGLLRTIDSLSRRSRVILAYGDWVGLLGIAAGADALGSGWDATQRCSSPDLYRSGGSGRYVARSPHPGMLARFSGPTAEALEDAAPLFARTMRDGADIPSDEAAHRAQHLGALRERISLLKAAGGRARSRTPIMRQLLREAEDSWAYALRLGVGDVGANERDLWVRWPAAGYRAYASVEGY